MPLVSVVMSSYNHEKFLSEAIESVLDQDFGDFELIIVDDASTDSSKQIIQNYQAKDARIRVIFHEQNCGIAKTANEGIEIAKGKFLAITASDDVWMKNKLSKQLEVVGRDEDLVVWSEGQVIDAEGQFIGQTFSELHGTVSKKKSGNIFQELLAGNYIFASSLLYKKENAKGILYDENLLYLSDFKFALNLARKYNFYYLGEPLVKYRIHAKGILSSFYETTMQGVKLNPRLEDRARLAAREQYTVAEHMIHRYHSELSGETQASVYGTYSCDYEALGDYKHALNLNLRAIRCNPISRTSLTCGRAILRLIYHSLTRKLAAMQIGPF